MLSFAKFLPTLSLMRDGALMAGKQATRADTGEIFKLDEVAAYLKVGKRTVYRLSAAKKIPAFKVGGAWRFSRADIDSWIKQQSMDGGDIGRASAGLAKGKSSDGGRK